MADPKSFSQPAKVVSPGNFEMVNHYYTRVQNAQLHPLVSYFMNLTSDRLVNRYCHLNPRVKREALEEILNYHPRYLPWAGADLFHVTTAAGRRKMVVIETNSCPSGQKSMPLVNEHQEQGGYRTMLEGVFRSWTKDRDLPQGRLAVVYDKNHMENSGYAATLADIFDEDVFLVEFHDGDPDPSVRFEEGVMKVRDIEGQWHPIRAAFRYVTQRPWNRIPVVTKTAILNPILSCLAGGRNKMMAAKAYDLYNSKLNGTGLSICIPETVRDVEKREVPIWIDKFGGHAVIKVPYSNAGQGVFTITSQEELDDFMEQDYPYDQFIVQSLIGNYRWSSGGRQGRLYHVGTFPNKRQNIYVADIRLMVCGGKEGFQPLACYSRRSRVPLAEELDGEHSSWEMLGTNLSFKTPEGTWDTDTNRLLLMDRRDFNSLGIGLDDLIEGYIQTVLAAVAIDDLAKKLINKKGNFRRKLFSSLNDDPTLVEEIIT